MVDHGHIPVLPEATVEALALTAGQTVLDCTLGRGGHAERFIPLIADGQYIGLDVDPGNLAYAQARLAPLAERHGVALHTVHTNFRAAPHALQTQIPEGFAGAHALLADIGFASNQVDDPDRGLLFKADGPLDMRLDPTSSGPTARDLVNQLPEKELADLIYGYGEERLSRRIARRIVEQRTASGPIETTAALAELVRQAYPRPRKSQQRGQQKGPRGQKRTNPRAAPKIHPATRTFQALRIAVNDELGALNDLLTAIPDLLAPGGRAAIISFHSLEDRRVKQTFLKYQQDDLGPRVTRKPIIATDNEVQNNPRSRSAKMRVWQKKDA